MSTLLTMAARLDPLRAAHLAANDHLMATQGTGVLRAFVVRVKRGNRVRLAFECMAPTACDAATQHMDLAGEGEYVTAYPLAECAGRSCMECVVTGGATAPASTGLCTACRSLAATFASRYPEEVPA